MFVVIVECVHLLTELGYNRVLGVTQQHLSVKHVASLIVSTCKMLASVIVWKYELCNNMYRCARIIFYVLKCNCLGKIHVSSQ